MYEDAQLPGDKVTGLGGTNIFTTIFKGIGFVGRLLSKKGRANDVHSQAAQDKGNVTTDFVIQTLTDHGIH